MITISTAFKTAQIGLRIGDIQEQIEIDSNCKHSENVLKTLNELLEKNNLTINDSDCIATVVGPGSFTGIRIGIAVAKGLACVNKEIKLISISSLDLIAYNYINTNDVDEDFYCAIDALSGLYFVAKYNKEGEKIGEESLIDSEELSSLDCKLIGIEDSFECIKIDLKPELLLSLSLEKYNKGQFVSRDELVPVYIRKSQAEMNEKR